MKGIIFKNSLSGEYVDNFAVDFPAMRVGCFFLAKGEVIPLHLHPGQYLFAYLISGKAEVETFSILEHSQDEYKLKLTSTELLSSGEYQILTPEINGHRITAIQDCWMLDSASPGNNSGPLSVYQKIISDSNGELRTRSIAFDQADLPKSFIENPNLPEVVT